MKLGAIFHLTADRGYEDLRQVQAESTQASDRDRKRKMIEYCETQRHRAFQLLALLEYANSDHDVVEVASKTIGDVAFERIMKYQRAIASLSLTVDNFEVARAPQYDIPGAVDLLINQKTFGIPAFIDTVFESEDESTKAAEESRQIKRARLAENRITSQVLMKEWSFISDLSKYISILDSGEILLDYETTLGFTVKLSVEIYDSKTVNKPVWYPTALKVSIRSDEKYGKNDAEFIPARHVPVLAANLERVLASKKENASALRIARDFMQAFCGNLVLEQLESQARLRATSLGEDQSAGFTRHGVYTDFSLGLKGWSLRVKTGKGLRDEACLFKCSIVKDLGQENDIPSKLDGSEFYSLSISRMKLAALREAAEHQLREIQEGILSKDSRHDVSQTEIVRSENGEFELRLRLFTDVTHLIVKVNASRGSLEVSTTSKATRWGTYSLDEALEDLHGALENTAGDVSAASVILVQAWKQAEAWDCLSCVEIPGLTDSRACLLPPSTLIAQKQQAGPASFWDLGLYEGFRYVLVVRYVAPASSFLTSFQQYKERLDSCTLCELISYPSKAVEGRQNPDLYVAKTIKLSAATKGHIDQELTQMREERAVERLRLCGLEMDPNDNLWRPVQGVPRWDELNALAPFDLIFAEEGDESPSSCYLRCNHLAPGGPMRSPDASSRTDGTDQIQCPRSEFLDTVLWLGVRRNTVLERLKNVRVSDSAAPTITLYKAGSVKYCELLWKLPVFNTGQNDERRLFVGFEADKLSIKGPHPHPLAEPMARYWEMEFSQTDISMGVRLLHDSIKLVVAAERYAKARRLSLRVRPISILVLHFYFDNPEKILAIETGRRTFTVELNPPGIAYKYNVFNFDPDEAMRRLDGRTVHDIETYLDPANPSVPSTSQSTGLDMSLMHTITK